MLGYITKDRKIPECLQGFPVSKQDTMHGTIYRLKTVTIANPHDLKIIKIPGNDNLSVFKITDTFDSKALEKPNPIGDLVELNGCKMHVPKLRVFDDGTQLPLAITLTENGIAYQVKQEHLKAYSLGSKILDDWLTGLKDPTTDEIIDAVTTILQVNYWITRHDIVAYALISTDIIANFLGHCVDIQTRLDWYSSIADDAKKKLLAEDSSES